MYLEKLFDIRLLTEFCQPFIDGLKPINLLFSQLAAGQPGSIPFQDALDGVELLDILWVKALTTAPLRGITFR
jgi:hypothetical protein